MEKYLSENNLLVVENLKKIYSSKKSSFTAVDDISFTVKKGECFGLLGPNGAGKSTSMNCITGFYPINHGKILINNIDVHKSPKLARRFLGVCSQDDSLDTDFSVIDQMVTYASYFGIDKKTAQEKSESLLKRFFLDDKAKENVESLSGGMRRRLQVARALVGDPQVLILDEPTTGLDPEVRRELWDIIVESREKGMAILLSTHYMDEAERLCDRIAILHNGKILDCDTPQNLITRHAGTNIIEEEIRPGMKWKRPPNIEDVYLNLTGRGLNIN
ncbi:MAG: ABC transporter ATP-binding protein [Candidatus Sericytochromatia bacterium]|nr:ABC transporter ATP-binding protein [Candidatus Sericytochromatia bacterium]